MLKHIEYRDRVVSASFGDIVFDGEGNVTSDFTKEEKEFLLTIPGYYREGYVEEADKGKKDGITALEAELLETLPKEIVDHLPQNRGNKGAIEEAIEGKSTEQEFNKVKEYGDITVADLEKELKAEKVEFDKKSNKKEKYGLYVKAKTK